MAQVSIRLAQDAIDFDAVRALCLEWLDWHWRHYPRDWPIGDDHPMDPTTYRATVQELAKHHERPRGGILVGLVDGQAAGCVMWHEVEAGVAEFKRMYVSEAGRGHGLGRQMLDRMFDQMTADGFRQVVFSSAAFLTHARKMYEGAGFAPMPHPEGFPDDWRDRVYFMQRALV